MKGSPGSEEEEEVKETLISILLHFQKPKGENKTMGRKKNVTPFLFHILMERIQTRNECFGVLRRH